jgi:uncharacterized protein
LKVFLIKRKFLLLILLGSMIGLGFCSVHISHLQNVLTPQKKEVAIVIDDFGGRAGGIKEMMALPYALTFAVMPFEEFSYQQAELAVNKGYEIIIHLPFEAVAADPHWYGKKYISAHSSPGEIKEIIDDAFNILPMAVGLSNHMGSKATADPQVMAEVFRELEEKKCFYFDSRTTPLASPALSIATDLNLPYARRDVFLDNANSASSMDRQLNELMELARARGMAVGIGHVGQSGSTLAALLHKELPKYEKEGFRFVTLSKLVYSHVSAKPSKNKGVVIGIDPDHGKIDSGTP